MICRAALVLALGACGKSASREATATAAAQTIQTIRGWAERACACNADKGCVKPIREEWDAAKHGILETSQHFPPTDKATFDRELLRFRECGDAAGLTIWLE